MQCSTAAYRRPMTMHKYTGKVREPFDVHKYTDAELVLAWYWFSRYPGIGYAETQEKFYIAMREKTIAVRAERLINRGE